MRGSRDYQIELAKKALKTPGNILIQADTGSGKTHVLGLIAERSKYVLVVAHRNLLIKQISKEMARFEIVHDIVGTTHTKRQCTLEHRDLGKEWLGKSNKYVVSIDSLLARKRRGVLSIDTNLPFIILIDEGHHVVEDNKWGSLSTLFPNAKIIAVTATVCRGDNEPLARTQGGLFDQLIQAEALKKDSVKTLIKWGYMSDFKCYSVPELIDGTIELGRHDYKYSSLCAETKKVMFEMAGDAVKHYRRLADSKQTVAFCVSIEIAELTAKYFREGGYSAACIHSKMSTSEVTRIFKLFERRVINVICHVDMIGEGVDVPAIECLIMLRKTASFGAYRQWIGRGMRTAEGKDHAIIIDHVGNVRFHDMPDKHIEWDLENPPVFTKSNLAPCENCRFLFKAFHLICPECGHERDVRGERERQKEVKYIDWDLVEIERARIAKEWKESNILDIAQEMPSHLRQLGTMGKALYDVQLWFCEQLKDTVSIKELNTFFKEQKAKDKNFWIKRFTAMDAKTNNKIKCEKAYRECR